MLALVGESGSGKSMTFLSALGLVPRPGRIKGGAVLVGGRDLVRSSAEALRASRGSVVSMIFPDPLSGLNPVFSFDDQIVDVIMAHRRISRDQSKAHEIHVVHRVQLTDERTRFYPYPLLFSRRLSQDPT